ncbi:hypothetical protein F5984_12300 [Rudanella paleaurantiibacter]|uniref:Tetratricopeptide repeat protein n=1 Tax=Rudanella paleaurantiibacter TaxID=2614655 RepID=A0A7J5TXV1_9BACT|nr:hypothetical protein [Rudanella paleaurantiibacter]KAB7729962.1 hypothetical protein F5984_12300 [Rudanella paleaurantiibacter]
MTDWNLIDDYFANRLSGDARTRFEQALQTDPDVADAVAFYLAARSEARQEAQDKRRAEWLGRPIPTPQRSVWPYVLAAAASVVLLLGLAWVFWSQNPSPAELADSYIARHTGPGAVTMGAGTDSLQQGLDLANRGELAQADTLLTDLYGREPTQSDVLTQLGLVALRRGQYDRAIGLFQTLSARTDLYANPGLYYEALTRLKRNEPNDKKLAKALLQTVIRRNLEGAAEARELLEQL